MTANEEKIKVSIIITCYNLQYFVQEAIGSLLDQVCDFAYEIIVVDDASTDNSREVIAGIQDPRVKLIALEKNAGAPQAINIGFAQASGEYLCRFDADDKWYPNYLQKAAALLDANPGIVLVHTDVSFIDEHGRITSERNNIKRPASLQAADHEFAHILSSYYINAPAIMARKSAWDSVMPWPERFRPGLGDWFLTLCMLENSRSYFINEPLAYYRIHTTNMHRAMIKNRSAEANTAYILDYFQNRTNGITPAQWKRIRFEQSKHLGFAYFFHGMDKDAGRCLSKAIQYNPAVLANTGFMRIWLACIIGQKTYNRMKSFFLRRKPNAA
jgi:glycosyltransferase involved in cell wall biosynthesis